MPLPQMSPEAKLAYDEAMRRIEVCLGVWNSGTFLNLSDLGLAQLPPEIGKLSGLKVLCLSNNKLISLPPEIGKLSALTRLELSNNKLTSLPPEIGKLSALTRLDLSYNQLTSLPPEIGMLSALMELELSNNNLINLPPEIGKLSALTRLYLFTNDVTSPPPEIGKLSALMELGLSSNHLTSLPAEIGKLPALTRLELSNNQLTSLPPEIGKLSALTRLDVSYNRLISLPPEIGTLSALTDLNLSNDQLTSLPREIGRLSALTELYLDNNQLTNLPSEIRKLSALTVIYLHDNPFLGIPPEVLGPRWKVVSKVLKPELPKAILDHYFALQSQGERPLNEVRLVLVGRGGAGKTSLVQQLVHGTHNRDESETPGIALSDWVMKDCAGDPVTAHVWDFAGQVITHSMHRYFLSHRTVYLLVLTQREDLAGEDAEYWLKLINSYGTEKQNGGSTAGPPVLVVLNKWDKAKVKVDRGALRERFPFIIGFVETDCATGFGIPELRTALCHLMDDPKVKPWVRQGYPKQWWEVKEAIREVQRTKPHVSYDEWRRICDRCGVTDAGGQDAASRDLHTLGVALNYADDDRLHDNTVLRPNWVTHHCYALIRHAEKHHGELHRADLAEVLGAGPDGEHEEKMHLYLMRLMERFEAAYPLGEEWPPERWLVPLGLPDNQPEGVEVFGKTAPSDAARLRYIYSSVPPGLLAQFIVRTHPLMEPKMQWASGTVLALNDARALVRAVSKTEIEVTAIGANQEARRDIAGLCREELRGLHNQISGLDVREKTEVVAEGEVVWANVRTLEQDELKGKTQSGVETDVGTLEVETKKELDEFGTEEGRLPDDFKSLNEVFDDMIRRLRVVRKDEPRFASIRRSQPKPVVFISYSHEDERHRKRLDLHLQVLKIQGLVHAVWHDRRIQPGMDWDRAIQDQLAEADVVIFLISTAALASGYINADELRPALERYVKGEAVVVPLILERCDWVDTFAASEPLQKLEDPRRRVPQGLPRDGKPIRSFSPQSDGWHQVAEGLKEMLTTLKEKLSGKE